jgi:hypothetical protein
MDIKPGERNLYNTLAKLLIPFLILAFHILILYLTLPPWFFSIMIGLMTAYVLPPAGKETVIPIGIALGIPWWYMALSIAMIDIETGLFMAWNFDLAYDIPLLGKLLGSITSRTRQFIGHHPRITGLYFFGIVLMVSVPFLGSGGVRGSIAGRLLGMDARVLFTAIVIGALAGCFGIALGSEAIIRVFCTHDSLPGVVEGIMCNRTPF